MTGTKSKNVISARKHFHMAGKFKAFINVMLADGEKEWKIFKERHPQFFDLKENQKFKYSPLAESMIK